MAAAIAVVVTALLMSVASIQRAGAASAHRTPVVLEQARSARGYWSSITAVRRPHLFRIMMGGPNLFVRNVRWTAWHDSYARGSGELIGQDMGTYRLGHVTLKLNHVVTSHGYTYFGYLHIVGGRHVVHYWKWNWFPRVQPDVAAALARLTGPDIHGRNPVTGWTSCLITTALRNPHRGRTSR